MPTFTIAGPLGSASTLVSVALAFNSFCISLAASAGLAGSVSATASMGKLIEITLINKHNKNFFIFIPLWRFVDKIVVLTALKLRI